MELISLEAGSKSQLRTRGNIAAVLQQEQGVVHKTSHHMHIYELSPRSPADGAIYSIMHRDRDEPSVHLGRTTRTVIEPSARYFHTFI
jgi:hypothetical protein